MICPVCQTKTKIRKAGFIYLTKRRTYQKLQCLTCYSTWKGELVSGDPNGEKTPV